MENLILFLILFLLSPVSPITIMDHTYLDLPIMLSATKDTFFMNKEKDELEEFVIKLKNCSEIRDWLYTCTINANLFPGTIKKMGIISVDKFSDIINFDCLPDDLIDDWRDAFLNNKKPSFLNKNLPDLYHQVSIVNTGKVVIYIVTVADKITWLGCFEGYLFNDVK